VSGVPNASAVSAWRKWCSEIGTKAIASVTLEDFENTVAAALRAGKAQSTTWRIARQLAWLLKISAYPLKLVKASPLPENAVPSQGKGRAHPFLRPSEDAAMLACSAIPLERRMLMGLAVREGLREDELRRLEWDQLDFVSGTLRSDENKTDDARVWALDPGVREAFKRYQELQGIAGAGRVFSSSVGPASAMCNALRADLKTAGVNRPELQKGTPERQRLRFHDLRGSFVTVALGSGEPRNERWVMARTGHTTSAMLAKYHRAARHAAELELGWFKPMRELIPELTVASRSVLPDKGSTNGSTSNKNEGTAHGKNKRIVALPAFAATALQETD
jgi:integrase